MHPDATNQVHETKVIVFNRRDDWQAIVTCKCGWKESPVGESSGVAGAQASALGRAHVRHFHGHGAAMAEAATTPGGVPLLLVVLAVPVLLVAGLVLHLTGERDERAPVTTSSEPPSTSPPTSSATPTPPPTAKAKRTREPKVNTPAPADNELGLPHAVIVQLGQFADLFGYGLGPGTNLDYERATNFAYALSFTCDDLRSGAITLQESIEEDIRSGAPPSDARGFNRYLQDSFCREYYAAGN